ncbi:TPA: DNA-directed RNA polymerase subunit K [Candidatus Woesearchaeota archaeon]|nr:DNA-directed RNA polymerase subunit K [Candidatus Woesearchaeota archaeon]HII68250.1 DNA-directed RNA polymerase subunit K [Candidatus Woesearchaeota archaeon]
MTKPQEAGSFPTGFTKYEIARILGARALQISMGAPFLVKFTDKDIQELHYNPIEIAKREFAAGVVPITVKRTQPKKVE